MAQGPTSPLFGPGQDSAVVKSDAPELHNTPSGHREPPGVRRSWSPHLTSKRSSNARLGLDRPSRQRCESGATQAIRQERQFRSGAGDALSKILDDGYCIPALLHLGSSRRTTKRSMSLSVRISPRAAEQNRDTKTAGTGQPSTRGQIRRRTSTPWTSHVSGVGRPRRWLRAHAIGHGESVESRTSDGQSSNRICRIGWPPKSRFGAAHSRCGSKVGKAMNNGGSRWPRWPQLPPGVIPYSNPHPRPDLEW